MRVPVYDAPQVAQAALPEVRSHLDVSNGLDAVGEGISRLGAGAQRAIDIHAEKAAAGASTDSENGFANDALTKLHGSPDGSTKGFFQLQGKDALAQSAPTIQALQQLQQKYAANLSPQARALFVPRTNAMLLSWRGAVEDYATKQTQAANLAAAHALGDRSEQINGLQYADDKSVATANAAAETALAAQLHGMPGEYIQEQLDKLRQRNAIARVNGAIGAGDFETAERLLRPEQSAPSGSTPAKPQTLPGTAADAARVTGDSQVPPPTNASPGEAQPENPLQTGAQPVARAPVASIFGSAGPELAHRVDALRAKAMGQKNAAAAVKAATDPNTGLVSEALLDDAFNATPDAQKTPEFREAFGQMSQQALRLNQEHRAGVFRDAYSQYLLGGGLASVSSDNTTWLKLHDPEGWHRLQGIAQDDAAAAQRARGGGGKATPEQQVALGALLVDMSDHPDKYARMPADQFVRTWFPLLSTSDRKQAFEKLAERHQDAGKPEALGPLENRMLLQVGRTAGVFPAGENDVSKWNDDQFRAYYGAAQELSERAAAVKRATGKPPAPDELEKWARDLFLGGRVPNTGFFSDDKTTRIQAAQTGKPFVPDWSTDEKDAARAALQAAGARVDDAAVDTYLRRKHELPAAPISAQPVAGKSEVRNPTTAPVESATEGPFMRFRP